MTMMRAALFAVLAACAIGVAAQPACWPNPAVPLTVLSDEKPVQLGQIAARVSSVGLVWGYACQRSDGAYVHVVAGGPWSAFVADWPMLAVTALHGTDEQRAALWKQHVVGTTIDARLQADVDAVKARLPKPPPAPTAGSYVVMATTICAPADKDASGRCIRRQTYVWAGGTRGAAAAERVDIGAPCDPSIGAAGFYGVLGRTDRVALCVRR